MELRRATVAVGVAGVLGIAGAGAAGGFAVSAVLDAPGRGRGLAAARNADGPARPGAAGAGDVYFPDYGNGGYDVGHYTLRIRYDPGARRFDGRADVAATATHALSQFNLDFTGPDITALRVDGTAAAWRREGGHELVVTPPAPLGRGQAFRVEVEYGGAPSGEVFHPTADGAVVLGEPEGAAAWYPVNDHPTDKATYDFEITVPDGLSAIANGVPGGSSLDGGWRTWKWSARTALAPYLSMFVVGRFRTFEGDHDGLPVFSAVDERLPVGGIADQAVQRTPEVADFLASQFGPYPFEALGGVVTGEDQLAFALETQTRPVYAPVFFDDLRGATAIVAHELAHQWFGDSVALEQWRDIWLNEGFATYAQWLWEEHSGGRTAQRIFDETYAAPESAEFWRPPPGDPGRQSLFADSVYVRGALTVHALRLTIGDDAFFRLLKEWTTSRRGGNGTVADLVELAERTGGRQLDGFFQAWLYRESKPPPPGR